MFKKQLIINIEDLDLQIGLLTQELSDVENDEDYDKIVKKMEALTDLRCKLAECKNDNTAIKNTILSGALSVTSLLIVLKYEEKEVITTKAFSMVTSMFRGSK